MRTCVLAAAECEKRTSPLLALAHMALGCSHHLLPAKEVSISCATFAAHGFESLRAFSFNVVMSF